MAEKKIIELEVKSNLNQTNNDVSQLKNNLKNASNEAKDFDKAIGGKKGESFAQLKDTIGGLVPGFDKASTGASSFNKQLLVLVANPIGLVITAVVLAITGLVAIFRTFQPLVDKVEQSVAALGSVLNVIKNTFIAVFTGTKSLTQAFSGLGGEMSSAARRTMELVKAQQDLEDVLAQQEVQTSRTRAEINKLNVQAKNRALSEEERLKLLQKASALENQDFLQRRKNADEQVRQAREAIAIKAGFSKSEIKQLKEQGLAAKELAESKGGNFDEEFKILANAQKNRIGLEDESTANLEKNQNKQDALFDAQQAKRQKSIDDENVIRNKRIEQEKADAAVLKAFNDDILKNQQQMNVDKVNSEIQDYLDEKDRKIKSLEDISAAVDVIDAEDLRKAKLITDAKIELAKKEKEGKLQAADAVANTLSTMSDLLGKETAAGKAAAVASATINTFSSAQKAYDATVGIPFVGPVLAPINAGLAIAAGIKNVKSILAVKVPRGGGGGSAPSVGGDTGRTASVPNFNVVGASSTNQLAQTIGQKQNQPIKAYVVSNEVTTAQGLDRNIIKSATIG